MATIWGRPSSVVATLRLSTHQLRDLVSRELEMAHGVLDEWDAARTRDKPDNTSTRDATDRSLLR
jgi:hypothetical protein